MRDQLDPKLHALHRFARSIPNPAGRSRFLERLADLEAGTALPATGDEWRRFLSGVGVFLAAKRHAGLDEGAIVRALAVFLAGAGIESGPRFGSALIYADSALRVLGFDRDALANVCDIQSNIIDALWMRFSGQVADDERPQWSNPAPIIASM